MNTINVCGVLVFAQPRHIKAVQKQLEEEDGVEVHAVTDNGRLVVTIEKEDQQQTGDLLHKFQTLDHVITASMVYQYFDQIAANEWEMAS
ncbi:MAG: chaperone NapD [Rhodospirillales bacterium]|nr:chaperone NapD [Rhodospirillales bacterium]